MEHFRLSKGTKEIISLSFSAKYEIKVNFTLHQQRVQFSLNLSLREPCQVFLHLYGIFFYSRYFFCRFHDVSVAVCLAEV